MALPPSPDKAQNAFPRGEEAGCLSSGAHSSPSESLPRYHKRAFAHNYRAPFIYHIILKKTENCESFGSVKGDARIPFGSPGCARIDELHPNEFPRQANSHAILVICRNGRNCMKTEISIGVAADGDSVSNEYE